VEHARVATTADLPTLVELWDQAVAELDGQRGGALLAGSLVSPGPLFEALQSALSDDDRLLVLGDTDGASVGLAAARCDRKRREPVGVVDTIYVEPSARQVGVGEAMLDLVVQWSVARGCVGVDAPALPGNRAAKAFFEGQGFVARLLVMHHPIVGSSGAAS
jgi:GNAT superfamily N-acetyltransferase